MGRPVGANMDKPWRDAVRKAAKERYDSDELDRHGRPKQRQALLLMARKLVQAGMAGDIAASKETGDRLDGRPAQAVNVAMDIQITAIERRIVDAIDVESEPVEQGLITQDKPGT